MEGMYSALLLPGIPLTCRIPVPALLIVRPGGQFLCLRGTLAIGQSPIPFLPCNTMCALRRTLCSWD